MQNRQCVLSSPKGPSDLGCATWDWNNQVCLQCSNRWFFNSNKVCTPVSNDCNQYDAATGACTTCFKGYALSNGQCLASSASTPSDLGCATWDWNNQVCLACSNRWAFNSNRVCVPVSDNCNTYSVSGACTSCFKGYHLNNGQCSVSSAAGPTDLGCATWDWNNQVCLACSNRWFFNSNKVCTPVSNDCNQYNSISGACVTCFKGYSLSNGQCLVSSANSSPTDLGCATWDWNNQVCLACSNRWVFNSKKVCVPVSDNCHSYDASGACTSCFNGYALSQGQCQLSNNLCKTSNSLGCATCYNGYVLYQNNCVPLSSLADIVLYYTACCPEKLAQLKAEGRL